MFYYLSILKKTHTLKLKIPNLLMRVFVPDGFQFFVGGTRKHQVELSDDWRQV